jgi:hypothetical protein
MFSRHLPRSVLASLLLAGSLVASVGCSPTKYRLKADSDAFQLERESSWRAQGIELAYPIYADPRSRMFDPFDPDHEPMPPDDPASHELMHYIDGKKGYKHWHKNGDTPYVENPEWMAYLCFNEDGCVEVDSGDAVRLALLHSREYQSQLEQLYLSALDVSFERFLFDSQFFAGYQVQYTADGPERRGAGGESSSELVVATLPSDSGGIRMERFFATGGSLVVGLANSLVWQFSGPDDFMGMTVADFALVQPLLRGAGKAVNLERLTIAERTLLANVRQMERYRRGFYVQIMTGENAGQGPSRRGGVFGGAGLEGFSGVGGGGFGRVGGGGGGGGNGGFTGGAGAAAAGGYLGLLQEQQNIRNQEFNVTALQNSLLQLEELASSGLLTPLQVAQTRQALYNAQSRLLTSRTGYQSTLDRFKLVLGLPPQLCLEIDDPLLDPFNLISPEMLRAQMEVTRLQQKVGESLLELLPQERARATALEEAAAAQIDCSNLLKHARELALREGPAAVAPEPDVEVDPEAPLVWSGDLARRLRSLRQDIAQIEALRATLANEYAAGACQDIQQMSAKIPARLAQLEEINRELDEEFDTKRSDPDTYAAELRGLGAQMQNELLRTVARIDSYQAELLQLEAAVDELLASAPRLTAEELRDRLQDLRVPLADLLREFSTDVLELTLIQARARTETIDMVPVELEADVAIQIAQANRRDWANARASLVDTWRLITFNANDLKAGLDVVFEGDIQNVGDNPLNLQGSTGRLRARLEFDAPLTRLAERNTYRQAQIEYQEARRNFYAFRDNVARSLRDTLRTIDLNRLNFELRRRAIVVAITQVDLARLRLQEPPKPVAAGVGAALEVQTITDTAARDLVSALTDLLNAQNDFLSVWVNYEVQRRVLDWNLGTMQLDHDGLWIDPGVLGSETGFVLPPDCEDCQLEVELFGAPPRGLESEALPDEGAEELPPGVEVEEPAARPVEGSLLQAELRVGAVGEDARNDVRPAGFQEEVKAKAKTAPSLNVARKQAGKFRR